MSLSIKGGASCALVTGLLVQVLVSGCDLTSPMDPKDRKETLVPEVALSVSASNVKATAASWSEIDISWATSPSASGYQVWRSASGATGTYTQIATTASSISSYADTGLLASTQYCYEIRSFKIAGKNTTYGAFSNALCATTLPPPVAAPSQIDAVPQGVNIRLTWKDNSDNEDGFRIEMAPATNGPWTQVATAGANITTAANNWQVAERQACFRVTAYNAVGPSNPSTSDCTTIPAQPSGLSAQAHDAQSITLTWSDNSGVEDGYTVSRSQTGSDWADIASVGANIVSYRDATATPNTSYTYRVQAVKDGGYSLASNEARAVVATSLPAAPTNAGADFEDPSTYGVWFLTVAWTDASSNEAGFRVEYSADTLSGWSLYEQAGPDVSYIQEWSDFFPPPAGCYRVIAFNNVGNSTPSNATCGEANGAPGGLVATAFDQHTIDLTWADNAGYESGFEILRTTPTDDWSVVADVGPNTSSYRDSGLASGQDYTYYVVALYNTAYVCCAYSNYADATTPSSGAAPSASVQSSAPRIVRPPATRRIPIKGRPAPPTSARFRSLQAAGSKTAKAR